MIYKEDFIQGNYSKGRIFIPRGIVNHHNFLPIDILLRQMTERKAFKLEDGRKVPPASYHCVGLQDGSRISFAKDDQKAWHAGTSIFNGRKHCNSFMLGYSFHTNTNKEPLTYAQIHSYIEWLIPRIEIHKFKIEDITNHMIVSPGRKTDINPKQHERILTAIKYLFYETN